MLSTAPTVPDMSRTNPPRRRNWIVWALVAGLIAFAAIDAYLLVKYSALQKRAVHAELVADERAVEIAEMARQCGIAARVSLKKMSEPEEAADTDDQAEEQEPAGIDAGIDGSKTRQTERW
jgi:hypothetical protein